MEPRHCLTLEFQRSNPTAGRLWLGGAASLDARLQDIRPKPGFLVVLWAQNLGGCRVYTLHCYLNRFLEGVTAIGARNAIGDFANHARLPADNFYEL